MTRWWHCECGADNAEPGRVCAACGAGPCPDVPRCACGHPAARHAHDGMWCSHANCPCTAYRPAPEHTADTCAYTGWRTVGNHAIDATRYAYTGWRAAEHVEPHGDAVRWLDLAALEPAARKVVTLARDRCVAGRHHYGAIDPVGDPRDWLAEARDEAIDLAAYLQWQIDRETARRAGR